MSEASLKPVIAELETLFSRFNARFFENKLESPVITVSPDHTRGAYGWCTSLKAWQNGAKEGGFYEVNLCAEYLNRPYEELRNLRKHFPDLWAKLLDMEHRTWRTFRADYSVDQLEIRFAFEEERLAAGLPINRPCEFMSELRKRLEEAGFPQNQ